MEKLVLFGTWLLILSAQFVSGQSMPWGGDGDDYRVESDPIQGDWAGTWTQGPGGKAGEIVAQVIARGSGNYTVRILNYFDKRTAPYLVIDATSNDGILRFEEGVWSGEIHGNKFTGQGSFKPGSFGRFSMERVTRLSATLGALPPSGAVVLFNGADFSAWKSQGKTESMNWRLLRSGAMEINADEGVARHGLQSVKAFKDLKLHLEFRLPLLPHNVGQKRANSGVFIHGYEIQILDSYGLEGYENECGAFYKFKAPSVNMCAPPLQWQTYDIEYKAARFDASGKVTSWPSFTVFQNGKLIHQNLEMNFETHNKDGIRTKPPSEALPISLQHHGAAVQFRNIWVVER